MNSFILLVLTLSLMACVRSTIVDDDEIPPSFEFSYDNCVAALDNSEHPYHRNKFIVIGCGALLEQAQERAMFEERSESDE